MLAQVPDTLAMSTAHGRSGQRAPHFVHEPALVELRLAHDVQDVPVEHLAILSGQVLRRHDDDRNLRGRGIVFQGLDTYADVYLNGKLIQKADNMFRTWRVDVKNSLTTCTIVVYRSEDLKWS